MAMASFHQVSTSDKTTGQVGLEILKLAGELQPGGQSLTSRLPVSFPGGSYQVLVGRQLLHIAVKRYCQDRRFVIVTDSNVGPASCRTPGSAGAYGHHYGGGR